MQFHLWNFRKFRKENRNKREHPRSSFFSFSLFKKQSDRIISLSWTYFFNHPPVFEGLSEGENQTDNTQPFRIATSPKTAAPVGMADRWAMRWQERPKVEVSVRRWWDHGSVDRNLLEFEGIFLWLFRLKCDLLVPWDLEGCSVWNMIIYMDYAIQQSRWFPWNDDREILGRTFPAAPAVQSHLGWLFAHDPLESLKLKNVGS